MDEIRNISIEQETETVRSRDLHYSNDKYVSSSKLMETLSHDIYSLELEHRAKNTLFDSS